MNWHNFNPDKIKNVFEHENKAFEKTNLYPSLEISSMSTAFAHIFQGSYSSGYYSYKWAEVLDADAFTYFRENGIFEISVSTKFKQNILTKGGTRDPETLYKKFRGKEPSNIGLINRAGLK
jgi:peptidyl-dipeptidase Dcp